MDTADSLLDNDDFTVFIPDVVGFSIAKAGSSKEQRRIGGYCSTSRRDRQDEVLVQRGLNFDEFVQHGWFNDNHKQGINDVLGYPELARHDVGKGWYTEGYLLKTAKVDELWELAKALEDTKRRLGFSIEGKVMLRGDDGKILKAKIRNVAITQVPVNTDCTWSALSKAFGTPDEVLAAHRSWKALTAGYGNPTTSGARVLSGGDEESSSEEHVTRKSVLSFDEAVMRVHHLRPKFSFATCERIVKYAINKERAA